MFSRENCTHFLLWSLSARPLNDLECDTVVVYWERLEKKQKDTQVAENREAEARSLPPAERQAQATPPNPDVDPVSSSQADLYPNWVRVLTTKPQGSDQPRPYRMPKEEGNRQSALEKELDVDSVFDPLLGMCSQSSQQFDSYPSASPDTTMGATGPLMPLHFSETPLTIPPFDLTLIELPALLSPVTADENVLLNLAPGSPIKRSAPPGIGLGARVSGWSSCSDSPMLLGSPAPILSLALALKVRASAPMPALLDAKMDLSDLSEDSSDEEEMDAVDTSPRDTTD